ncbi:MAG: DUF4388 domain-containing protein [Nannocystaceae bacterium]|nr:DUF4388 domain-containing protein [bacterium]
MAKTPDRIEIDDEGSVSAEGETRRRLRDLAGPYRMFADAPGLIVLRREIRGDHEAPVHDEDELDAALGLEIDSGHIDAGVRVILAGEIINRMTLFQMIEIIAERGLHGDLTVLAAGGSTLAMRLSQGALVDARSDHGDDRLGQVLVRAGYLSETQLTELLWEVSPQRRLGEVCLERGLLGREALFECLRQQTEGIFFRALMVDHGSFVFTTPDARAPSSALSLHIPVRPLLMHGIQRLDEMELYRDVIPNDDVILEPRPGKDPTALDPEAQRVLAMLDGSTSLGSISSANDLGEYEITRIAYNLVKARYARVGRRSGVDDAVLDKLVDAFAQILDDIFFAIGRFGDRDAALSMLGAWVQGCGYDSVFGESIITDGTIDKAHVRTWVAASHEGNPLASFHQVAHELVSFAMFCAGSALPREHELALSRDVNQRLSAISSP